MSYIGTFNFPDCKWPGEASYNESMKALVVMPPRCLSKKNETTALFPLSS